MKMDLHSGPLMRRNFDAARQELHRSIAAELVGPGTQIARPFHGTCEPSRMPPGGGGNAPAKATRRRGGGCKGRRPAGARNAG